MVMDPDGVEEVEEVEEEEKEAAEEEEEVVEEVLVSALSRVPVSEWCRMFDLTSLSSMAKPLPSSSVLIAMEMSSLELLPEPPPVSPSERPEDLLEPCLL